MLGESVIWLDRISLQSSYCILMSHLTLQVGNKDITGYTVGFGYKRWISVKYEVYYTDFEDFTINASGGK